MMTESDDASRPRSKWLDPAYGEDVAARRQAERRLIDSRWVRFASVRGPLEWPIAEEAKSADPKGRRIGSRMTLVVFSIVAVLMLVAVVIGIGGALFG